MKKISIFLVIVLTIVAAIGFKYMSYKNEYNAIQKENKEFEEKWSATDGRWRR